MRNWMIAALIWLAAAGIAQGQESNAQVIRMWEKLLMRAEPVRSAAVIAELAGETPLLVSGRSADNVWFYVQANGAAGWVASGYVELAGISLAQLPVMDASAPVQTVPAPSGFVTSTPAAPAVPAEPTPAPENSAIVRSSALNLRAAPSTGAGVLASLPAGTSVTLLGRNPDGLWLLVRLADNTEGWVYGRYLQAAMVTGNLPVIAPQAAAAQSSGPAPAPGFFTLGATSRQIFAAGQALGNRRDVFSKIGDSITVADVMYRPFGMGAYDLGGYGYLQPTIDFFTRTTARDHNSFANTSLSANNGWTTASVLSAEYANQQLCQPNEAPLVCEYRVTRPAVALIMLGTNDVTLLTPEQYAGNLRTILQISIDHGVIPVLSTIPPRNSYEPQTDFFNELIVQAASEYGVSLWDYGAVMRTLPVNGWSADGVHPSEHPGGFAYSANFTGDNLKYGYVMRNLTALQVLDTLRREVLER